MTTEPSTVDTVETADIVEAADAVPAAGPAVDLDRPLALHPLTFLDEGSEVTVGRADIDSYCVLPADGAALLRELAAGRTPAQASQWYQREYGESVDMAEFLAALDELEFVVGQDERVAEAEPVRWQRLGRVAFSPPAWLLYALLLGAGLLVMIRQPAVAPHYRNVFFTDYMTVLELVMFLGQFPLLLIHEGFHTLAGRRLGLRSRLGIGRRLYFVVFETSMDGLVAVPRRQRYLPMLAGMLADLLVIAVLSLIAAAVQNPDGSFPLLGGVCLALAFGTLLRFVWQFYFYLQTDLYHVIVTVLGCLDLQKTARRMAVNRWHRLTRHPERATDESRWHPRDRAVARWYSWLLVVGYAVSIGTLVLAALPAMLLMMGKVFAHLATGNVDGLLGMFDSIVFLVLNVGQFALAGWLGVRERRRRKESVAVHVLD
jgi:hypothetical protein